MVNYEAQTPGASAASILFLRMFHFSVVIAELCCALLARALFMSALNRKKYNRGFCYETANVVLSLYY